MYRLIDFVVAPCLKDELKNDLQGKKYSILLDESTDRSTTKHLSICIRYFSEKKNGIESVLLSLVSVVSTTGESLFGALKNCLAEFNLTLSDCIGFCSDGASNMVGVHNSVWSRVKLEAPHCVLFKCICHSLALCVEKAFKGMPSNVGYLLGEIPAWFSRSSLQREEYKEVFNKMASEEDNDVNSSSCKLPFLTLCPTRWLVRGEVLQRILQNWNDLKVYFTSATFDQGCRYKARTLNDLLLDDINYLYICFLTPIVNEVDKINKFFQATNADPEAMTQQLHLHYLALKRRVVDTNGNQLVISRVDFGSKFQSESLRCCREHVSNPNFAVQLLNAKERCKTFMLELLNQIEKRLPANKEVFSSLSFLKPDRVLSHVNRATFSQLPYQGLLHEKNVDEIEEQYRKVLLQPWTDEEVFHPKVPEDPIKFWAAVQCFQDGTGSYPYKLLATYALACLNTPVSNALVERMFSHVNAIKTDKRNRMGLKMIESITRIRTTVTSKSKCCKDFVVTKEMLQRFNSDMYHQNAADENSDPADSEPIYVE